jgi:hypothetical protein
MKKILLPALMLLSASTFAQSIVKNGTIYKEHPYITALKTEVADFTKGDTLGAASFYADTAKFADSPEPKNIYTLKQARAGWQRIFADWTITSVKQVGYPDGLEYASDPFVVQSWWEITVVNKKTQKTAVFDQVLFDYFNKDGKISFEGSYYDQGSLIAASK